MPSVMGHHFQIVYLDRLGVGNGLPLTGFPIVNLQKVMCFFCGKLLWPRETEALGMVEVGVGYESGRVGENVVLRIKEDACNAIFDRYPFIPPNGQRHNITT